MKLRLFAAVFLATLCQLAAHAQSAPGDKPVTVKVIAFDGGWNLPIWAAQRQGFFANNKLAVELSFTPNSGFLVTNLLSGKFDLGFASIDNVIAYQEGQGEAPVEKPDLFAFMGGDNGLLSVVTAAPIKSFADLKGKSLGVDAMTTGFAFVLREAVTRNGLSENDVKFVRAGGTANRYNELIAGKNDGTLLRTPFDLLASERGFNVLASGEKLGGYQGTVGVATRRWSEKNEETLVNFIRAYRAGLNWIYDPKNRPVAEALLVANIRDMTPALAKSALTQLLDHGLQRDGAIDAEGIRNVLALRSKYGQPQKQLTDAGKYFDRRYYDRAAAR
ncbi:MAG TPA: ABC transporter substrate-binding protein [Burkholderiaceae bacterium]|nr:ABC transporter substrate-binding protein [Burkholderiaceae bacterium]